MTILAQEFEAHRAHLRSVAFRMLGSLPETDDALQEAWIRLGGAGASGVENLRAWLTTIVARVCLDMLRARQSRLEDPHDQPPTWGRATQMDPEQEALVSDSVGLALLVVLETLEPAERLAFVLHDMFDIPFEEIAGIVGRSAPAARKLASRARQRIRGKPRLADANLSRQREVVGAFLSAARGGDFDGLLAVLDPEVVVRIRGSVPGREAPKELHGAALVAKTAAKGGAGAAALALVEGVVGAVVAPLGRLLMVLRFKITEGKIVEIEAEADQRRLAALEIGVLED